MLVCGVFTTSVLILYIYVCVCGCVGVCVLVRHGRQMQALPFAACDHVKTRFVETA